MFELSLNPAPKGPDDRARCSYCNTLVAPGKIVRQTVALTRLSEGSAVTANQVAIVDVFLSQCERGHAVRVILTEPK